MGREGGAQETELAPATGTGPWLTKVRKTIDGTSVKDDAGKTLTSINGITSTGEIDLGTQQKASVDTPNGTISTNVVDKSGSTLPSTGGMGIAPFLIIGCGIAAVAGVGLHMTRAKREEA